MIIELTAMTLSSPAPGVPNPRAERGGAQGHHHPQILRAYLRADRQVGRGAELPGAREQTRDLQRGGAQPLGQGPEPQAQREGAGRRGRLREGPLGLRGQQCPQHGQDHDHGQ